VKILVAFVACVAVAATLVASSGADITKLTLSLSESSAYSYVSGTTLYYAAAGSNSGSFTVTATPKTDDGTDIDNVEFPALFGSDALEVDDANDGAYSRTYDWTASAADNGAKTVTATGTGVDETKDATFTVTADKTAPSGQTVSLSGGPGYATLSVPLLFDNGTDAGAGVDSSSGAVERASATLVNGACGTFGSFAAIALSGGTDTTVATANCYRYQYKIADKVGNVSTASAPSADAKVDATPPTTPSLSFGGLTNATASGSVVYVRAGVPGTFTVAASSADEESGIASYSFPDVPGFVSVGSGASRTYTFSGGAIASTGPFFVGATNGTGVVAAPATFSLAPDATAPRVLIRCNGAPCRASAYPKAVTVTLSATDTAGSGVGSIRYTFDGRAPTVDGGAQYEGPFTVKRLTHLKVRAYDKVGNQSALGAATIRSLADRLVFVAPLQVTVTVGARYLLARVTSSHHALATATLRGPGLKKPRRWRFVLGSGTSIVQFKLPKLSKPGRYTIVWTAKAGTRSVARTMHVVLKAKR
jgi:hypothetical protein